jgi:hypothetical protein
VHTQPAIFNAGPCYVGGCSGGPAKVDPSVVATVQQKCNTARDMNDMYDNIDSLYAIIGVGDVTRSQVT